MEGLLYKAAPHSGGAPAPWRGYRKHGVPCRGQLSLGQDAVRRHAQGSAVRGAKSNWLRFRVNNTYRQIMEILIDELIIDTVII